MIGIYKLTSPSGKIYIGQSYDIEYRMRYYRSNNCKQQRKLYHSLLKYGFENHLFEVLEEIQEQNKVILDALEIKYIRKYVESGHKMLNLAHGGISSGMHSEETKEIIRKKRALQKPPTLGKIYKPKIHTCKLPPKYGEFWKGRKHTMEAREKQRLAKLGKPNYCHKLVMNIYTGIYYDSLTDAAFSVGTSMKNMSNRMRGISRNFTGLIYV